jgi:ABC-type multidrug transport system fused ATPase/permease subunit
MKKFDALDNTKIEALWTWKVISILSKWIWTWTEFIFDWIRVLVQLLVSVIATSIIILQVWKYYHILFLLLIIFISAYLMITLTKKTKSYRKYVVESKINYDRQLIKMIMGKFEILQNWKINKEINKLDTFFDGVTNGRKWTWNYVIFMALIPDTLVFIIYISFLFLLVFAKIPFSIIISFFLVLWFLRAMIDNLVWFCSYFSREFYSIEKFWDFFDTTPEIKWLKTGEDFIYKTWDIKLKNITFSYWDNSVFENFSLDIKWNQITAFVWESWWWKTTLMKLISGFIEPNSWEIIIDNQKLNEINLMSYYKEIWYLTQEPSVFDGTILENLTYWSKEQPTEKKLKEVIKKAKCEFIYDFKNWLDTEIWERGIRLSWWQKQRLAIAKIFLKNPKIIFLDEPTSALDSKSEKLIHESFEELFNWRTAIIIAHRLQTIKSANKIFVLENWKVVESWTHNTLSKQKWHYREMLDLQSGF